jgi:hypothetical protein
MPNDQTALSHRPLHTDSGISLYEDMPYAHI